MYSMGIAHANWSTDKANLGSYPLDVIGMHLYIDQGIVTSASKIATYMNAVRTAYLSHEGSASSKQTGCH